MVEYAMWAEDDAYERPRLDLLMLRAQPVRIVRQSLSEQAASAIKSRILSLDLPPGTRLVIDVLADELGVSRTPVREGLRELVAQGLVTYDGNSYVVTSYARQDVENLFAIRRALEVLAVSQAAQRMSDETLQELRALCDEGEQRIAAGDTEFLITMDMQFHYKVSQGSQNSRLQSLLDSLREQCWLIRRWGFLRTLVQFVEQITLEEHAAILDRLSARDPEGAARLMDEHLRKGEQRTLEWLGL